MPSSNLPDIVLDKEDGLVVREVRGVAIHRSAADAKEINGFLDLVSDAIADYQRRLGIASGSTVTVKYITPREYLESPDEGHDIILFKLISRDRWNTTADGTRKPWRPSQRATATDPSDDTNIITIFNEVKENLVEFAVYSKHSKRANDLALFFERFMSAYSWYFKEMGIKDLRFEHREEDRTVTIGNDEFAMRPIRYRVFTELITQEVNKKIQVINIQYDVGNKLQSTKTSDIPLIIEHSIDHGA